MSYHTMAHINLGMWIIYFLLYFLPTLVCMMRHGKATVVFWINLLTGWTGVGWVLSLILGLL